MEFLFLKKENGGGENTISQSINQSINNKKNKN